MYSRRREAHLHFSLARAGVQAANVDLKGGGGSKKTNGAGEGGVRGGVRGRAISKTREDLKQAVRELQKGWRGGTGGRGQRKSQ